MTKELKLNIGNRYNIIALLFFIPYIIFEFPGTVFARIIGPRAFLGGICTLWGIVMICFGLANTWGQLAGMRVLLGVFEAGYFPACVYLLSTYYTRCELGRDNRHYHSRGRKLSEPVQLTLRQMRYKSDTRYSF